jgi:threonine dehydrogenase-like Zn-dependent dehydrogenase
VLVYGDGLIGQLAAQSAVARGARVILVGHREERLALAGAHSAEHVIDDRSHGFIDRVREWVGAATVSAVIDTVQSPAALTEYVELLEPGQTAGRRGQVVYSGFTPGTVWGDMALLQQRELDVHFVSGWARSRMEAALALMAEGKLKVRPLVTHVVTPDAAPDMYAMILGKSEPHLGVVFDWRGVGV